MTTAPYRLPMGEHIDPDCTAGKHRACIGETWDDDRDTITACTCPCHDAGFIIRGDD